MTACTPSPPSRGNATRWTELHSQMCSLLELADTDDDYLVAVRRRFGSSHPPGSWEPIVPDRHAGLVDVVAELRLPPSVSSLGVVTWATARRVTAGGFDETAAWIGIVTTSSGVALSATVTVDSDVLWTPYPTGHLAETCRGAFSCGASLPKRRS